MQVHDILQLYYYILKTFQEYVKHTVPLLFLLKCKALFTTYLRHCITAVSYTHLDVYKRQRLRIYAKIRLVCVYMLLQNRLKYRFVVRCERTRHPSSIPLRHTLMSV